MNSNQDIIIYQSGEIEIKVSITDETIWLRQNEISKLFEKDRTVITRHINNILKDKEVDEKSNVQKMHFPNSDKPVKLYSLDIILAVGYRTNSAKAISFRQWATNILRNYILNGYVINREKITHQRFKELEDDVINLKSKVDKVFKAIEAKDIKQQEGIFYQGKVFDAYVFIADLIKKANKFIILVDNYIDEKVLLLLSKRKEKCKAVIYTEKVDKSLKLDLEKHNKQYPPIEVKIIKKIHDRFLIIDKNEIYHNGASIKNLGEKLFAITKMDRRNLKILDVLKDVKSIDENYKGKP